MAKQVLILDPEQELHFKGPFNDVVTSFLNLKNPSENRVCFKVKTTAPKKYCVRPNSGILEPGKETKVAVMLQPFDFNPNEKNKHKFMVQTTFIPEGSVDQDIWRDVKPENVMDSKLRCVFDMPTEDIPNNNLDTDAVQIGDKTNIVKTVSEPSVKASPKVTSTDVELKKVVLENKRLKDEMLALRQENSQLKEEQLRLRVHANSEASGRRTAKLGHKESLPEATSTFSEKEEPQSSMLYLAVILTIGLLGIFIGKFIV